MATTLNITNPKSNAKIIQILSVTVWKILFVITSVMLPFNTLFIVTNPSPNRGGIKYTMIPNKTPPINKRLYGLVYRLKKLPTPK